MKIMTLIRKDPVGRLIVDLYCKHCGKLLCYNGGWSDGILEAMGKEPISWMCHNCKKGYTNSQITKVEWFREQEQDEIKT